MDTVTGRKSCYISLCATESARQEQPRRHRRLYISHIPQPSSSIFTIKRTNFTNQNNHRRTTTTAGRGRFLPPSTKRILYSLNRCSSGCTRKSTRLSAPSRTPPVKLTYAQAAAAPLPPPPPPLEPKFFDLLKLPQELKEKIYEYYYASRTITVTYERKYEYTGRRRRRSTQELKISERPSRALFLVAKKITQTAAPFCAQAPIDLTIPYDEDKGLCALQAICSDGIQYNALRMKVRDLTLCGFDGRCSLGGLGHAYNLVAIHFPNLKRVIFITAPSDRSTGTMRGPLRPWNGNLSMLMSFSLERMIVISNIRSACSNSRTSRQCSRIMEREMSR